MKKIIPLLCLALCSLSAFAAPAPTGATTLSDSSSATDAAHSLVLGRTSLDEAKQIWADGGAQVLHQGRLAVGAGSGVDGMATIAVDEVLLVDVGNTDFEGLPVVRYGFVDGILYSAQVRLRPVVEGIDKNSVFRTVPDDEIKALERRLRRTYGPPTRSGSDVFGGKVPTVFQWSLRDRDLVLTHGALLQGSQLSMTHKALSKKAKAYQKATCRQHKGCHD